MGFTVDVVATDRLVWSGEASFVRLRTVDGELGVMGGHQPFVAILEDSVILIRPEGSDEALTAAVHGGFVLLDSNVLQVLAETAELSAEVDVTRAEQALARARQEGDLSEETLAAVRRAEVRLEAATRPHRA